MRHEAAAFLLRCAVIIYFGVNFQQMALAVPVETAVLATPNSSLATSLPAVRLKPVQIAQASQGDAGGDMPEQGVATPDSPAMPQIAAQEAMSTARQSGVGYRRRKPKMAGIPTGLQMVVQEQEAEKPTAPATPQMAVQEAEKPAAPQMAVEEEVEEGGVEGIAPGAIAARKAVVAQGETEKKYRMAPVRWRGTITETMGWRDSLVHDTGKPVPGTTAVAVLPVTRSTAAMTHVQTVMVGAKTYILKPWIATVSGRFGVMSGTQGVTSNVQTANDSISGSTQSRQNSLLGGGDLSMFSLSRFPLRIQYDADDSRNNDGRASVANANSVTDSNVSTKKLSLKQIYIPLRRDSRLTATYDGVNKVRQALDVGLYNLSTTTSSTWNGAYVTKLGDKHDQPFNLTASHGVNHATATGGTFSGSNDYVTASHLYMPEDSLLTLHNSASFFRTNSLGTNSPTASSSNLQLMTHGSWQPEAEDVPLVLTGDARFFRAKNDMDRAQTLSANIAATYNAWTRLSLSGGATLAKTNTNGVSSLSATQFGRAVYRLPAIRLWKSATYTRNTSAGFTNQISSTAPSNTTVYAAGSHALSAPYRFHLFGFGTQLNTSISQGLSVQLNRVGGSSETLVHNGILSWSPGIRENLPKINPSRRDTIRKKASGYASLVDNVKLTAYDSRTFGAYPAHSRLIGLSAHLAGDSKYNASATGYGASADVSVQATQRDSRTSAGATANARYGWGWSHTYSYNYNYKKAKPFGVRGLDYLLTFNMYASPQLGARADANYQTAAARAAGAGVLDQALPYGASLNQSLRYRIGQNEILLTGSLRADYGTKSASLFARFRAWRNFGN